jgi:RNA polymerase sigma-70 factor, ECF subfamily
MAKDEPLESKLGLDIGENRSREARMDRLEALLQRCRAGDQEALEELIRRWERKLFYYVQRLVEHEPDAWDILQQTWMRVLKGIGGVRDADKLVPWIYRVARNTALTHRKSLLAKDRYVDHETVVETLPESDAREEVWTAEQVHWGMEELSVHHRDALTLFFLNDLSMEEMAVVLGVSMGTVKSRLFYAKKALGAVLLEKIRSES